MYLRLHGPLGRHAYMQNKYSFNGHFIKYKGRKTHANEKLSTFWMAATGEPPIVMFVNGVLCSV